VPRRRADPHQLELAAAAHKRGTVERAAEADLRQLRQLEAMPAAATALAAAYRLAAREVDRAELERDRWGKAKSTATLRELWHDLTAYVTPPEADDALTAKLDAFELAASVRDTPTP
jgi:hypothetical protein